MRYGGVFMPVNVSIKNVPDKIVETLKKRARRNHRSLQGELMSILEEATVSTYLSVHEPEERLDALGFRTGDESVNLLRELRDGR
jgi:plasmid stability protein